jgi:hypothetical protein
MARDEQETKAPEGEGPGVDESSRGLERYVPQPPPIAVSQQNEAGAAALTARVKAEVEARTMVALRFPRSVTEFRRRILEACRRSAFADTALYAKPVGEGKVYGFSIRFAEECARHYGNLDIRSSVVTESDDLRVVECTVTDLEVNIPWSVQVPVPKTIERKNRAKGDEVIRERTNSAGEKVYIRRATADETFVLQNALVSKAIRNLILNHVPSDIREECRAAVEQVRQDEVRQDPTKFRKKLADAFFRVGVTGEQVEEYLGKPLEDANEAELFLLKSIGEAIAQGEGTWLEVMEERRVILNRQRGTEAAEADAPKGAAAKLRQKLDTK